MKIGIIGPSKLSSLSSVNQDYEEIIKEVAKLIAKLNHEIVLTPDIGAVSEFFGEEYLKNKGKKIYEIIPENDTEFGIDYLNLKLGEHINCNTWRNQPEKLNEETDVLICLGYSVGVMAEIAYSKWFNPKPIYILNELISIKLPKEIEKSLDLRYISYKKLEALLR